MKWIKTYNEMDNDKIIGPIFETIILSLDFFIRLIRRF